SLLNQLSESMSATPCHKLDEQSDGCRNDSYALTLKLISIASILAAGLCGVSIPLIGKKRRFLTSDSNFFVAAKAFAAGVILATGFVHMLPDATSALTSSCLPQFPWRKFPFSGFIAMMAALGTLLADFVGTQYYERKHGKKQQQHQQQQPVVYSDPQSSCSLSESRICPETTKLFNGINEEEGGGHSHSHGLGTVNEESSSVRRIIVSQVLEVGIVSHSVIIGLSLGVSQSPCTIGPLLGALSFHQLFEGVALGGCISQAELKTVHSSVMAVFFAVTTPLGIAVGIGISSVYEGGSPRGAVIEGVLDSISAGILVYMALVDLIGADFLSRRMSCSNVRVQAACYFALLFGALLMSSLAAWA
ncbi:hypothetical protein M569_01444, partial [Genlisea aurea]